MKDAVNRCWNNQKGVTLIELLAVVVILGVVAAIAAPSVITNFDDSKRNADLQTQAIIEDAAKRMVMDAAKEMPVTEINWGAATGSPNIEDVEIDGLKLINYLDANFDEHGRISTAEDPSKFFHLVIQAGEVTVKSY